MSTLNTIEALWFEADVTETLGMLLVRRNSGKSLMSSYLNSILQYLYSIKPLRQAVIDFEQDLLEFVPRKAESERSRRCKYLMPHE